MRRAALHAIDNQALYDRAFDGFGAPTKRLFGPDSQWHNPDLPEPEHDLAKATELVEEAKAEGWDGKVSMLTSNDQHSRDQALAITGQLEAAGFEVEVEYVRSMADLINQIYVELDYQVSRTGQSIAEEDPFWRLYEMFHSTSWSNPSGYASPEMDALLDELRTRRGRRSS